MPPKVVGEVGHCNTESRIGLTYSHADRYEYDLADKTCDSVVQHGTKTARARFEQNNFKLRNAVACGEVGQKCTSLHPKNATDAVAEPGALQTSAMSGRVHSDELVEDVRVCSAVTSCLARDHVDMCGTCAVSEVSQLLELAPANIVQDAVCTSEVADCFNSKVRTDPGVTEAVGDMTDGHPEAPGDKTAYIYPADAGGGMMYSVRGDGECDTCVDSEVSTCYGHMGHALVEMRDGCHHQDLLKVMIQATETHCCAIVETEVEQSNRVAVLEMSGWARCNVPTVGEPRGICRQQCLKQIITGAATLSG